MRAPSTRMYLDTCAVHRKTGVDAGDGNTPLGDWVLVSASIACNAHATTASERQAMDTVDVPITYVVRLPAAGSAVQKGDRLTLATSSDKMIVAAIRNTQGQNVLFVCECFNDPEVAY